MCTIGIGSIYYKFHTLYKFYERKIPNLRLLSVLLCTLGVGCVAKSTHSLKYFSKQHFCQPVSACFFSTRHIFFSQKSSSLPAWSLGFPKGNFTEFSKFSESLQNSKVVWLLIVVSISIQLDINTKNIFLAASGVGICYHSPHWTDIYPEVVQCNKKIIFTITSENITKPYTGYF